MLRFNIDAFNTLKFNALWCHFRRMLFMMIRLSNPILRHVLKSIMNSLLRKIACWKHCQNVELLRYSLYLAILWWIILLQAPKSALESQSRACFMSTAC